MFEQEFEANVKPTEEIKKNAGPPNRMNNLPYKEWMKFQKSFFRVSGYKDLYRDFATFFTKEKWDNGKQSESLFLSGQETGFSSPDQRRIEIYNDVTDDKKLFFYLTGAKKNKRCFDFILVNLDSLDQRSLMRVFSRSSELAELTRSVLAENKYCCFLLSQDKGSTNCWQFSSLLRGKLKLKDEKIGISQDSDVILNCMIFQSADDLRHQPFNTDITLSDKGSTNFSSWIIPKSRPRKKNEILHPAKFPEPLIEEFIKLFSKESDNIFDPMAGTGSTVVAAVESKRNGYGIELMEEFASVAKSRVQASTSSNTLFEDHTKKVIGKIVLGNAKDILEINAFDGISFDYCVTSPPYWSMLSNKGSENQKKRRDKNLKLTYSEDHKHDLGNIESYDLFVDELVTIYNHIAEKLNKGSVLTIIVKNVKRDHTVYPLAWDLIFKLCAKGQKYSFLGTTMWCQDDIGLKPFAVGIHWVSNTLHQYCLHLERK
ncbi:MAG TPA: site-specific DNA-methyltransferase [Flavisolibacter sp.]|jgi:DNA modification methylase|nr:site-specific DNA-methyltransferase [Flavisolibacter sp.]